MKVRDLMSTNISCVREDTPAAQIAACMKRENVGSLPVCDDKGCIKGIVTDRDLVLRVLAKAQNDENGVRELLSMTAADVMSSETVTVSPQMGSHDAALLLACKAIRRLPVTENSRLVGMLTLGDLARRPVCIDEAGDALSAISCDPNISG